MRISIVIPAYNAERRVRACLTSVLVQSHRDVECICVDDGSADGTRAILEAIAAGDDRVTVLSQSNAGVSAARNTGLAAATGDVVLFVDADDQLLPGALDVVALVFSEQAPDCAVFGLVIDPPEAAPLTLSHRLVPCDAVYEPFHPDLIFREHTHPYAFRVAFSRSFLKEHRLTFDSRLTLGEDEALLMTAYRLSSKTVLSSKRIYSYRMDDQSVSHRDNRSDDVLPAKLEKHLTLVSVILEDWKSRELDGSCDVQIVMWALDLLMLDVSRLEPNKQARYLVRLLGMIDEHFDGKLPSLPRTAQRCVADIRKAAEGRVRGPVVPKIHLIAFYVSSRGIRSVMERAIAKLKGRGAY